MLFKKIQRWLQAAIPNCNEPEWVESHMEKLTSSLSGVAVYALDFVCHDLNILPLKQDKWIKKAEYVKNPMDWVSSWHFSE